MKRKLKIKGAILAVMALTSIASVYAIQAVNSIDVTYDNSTSGLSSTNVKGAIDELYSRQKVELNNWKNKYYELARNSSIKLVDYVLSLPEDNSTVLQEDETKDHNMRFIGSNPNNYVSFNSELWRIIGVFNSNSHGMNEELVKIEKATKLSSIMKWHGTSENNNNDWTTSDIQKYLNGDYYYGMSASVRNMIQKVNWKIGGMTSTTPNWIAQNLYTEERTSPGANLAPNIIEWQGDIALAYPSDYMYATSGNRTEEYSRSNCLNYRGYVEFNSYWRTDGVNSGPCTNNSWLVKQVQTSGVDVWTLAPYNTNSTGVRYIAYSNSYGVMGGHGAHLSYGVVPAIYLKSSVICTNCSDSMAGTETKPYTLSYSGS